MFNLLKTDASSRARLGRLTTPHGFVDTPVFMSVGTQGSVKAITQAELAGLGAQIVLGNAYHLYLRPGLELIQRVGGLAAFMNWNGATLTDSGGYQVFSLAPLLEVTEEGVVKVRLTGACGGCPMAQMTLQMGIERYLKQQVPEVKSVEAVA